MEKGSDSVNVARSVVKYPDSFGQTAPRLRVLSLGHTLISRTAGRSRYSTRLQDWGIESLLLAPNRWFENGRWQRVDPPDETEGHVLLCPIRLPRMGKALWYLHYYPGLDGRVVRLAPAVLHVWEEPWSLVALQTVRIRSRVAPGVPVVLEVEQNIAKRLPPPFEQIRMFVLNNADYILARSQEALDVVRAKGYLGPGSLINHAVDPSVFRQSGRAVSRSRYAMRGVTIGYVGRLIVEKGLDDVLTALNCCDPGVHLMVMGDGPYRAQLVKRVQQLGLVERVRFLPWSSPNVVSDFINGLDALVLVTRTTHKVKEQFGRVIIEAHYCGVPVIGSSSGAIPGLVGSGGWIILDGDVIQLAKLLDDIAANPSQLQRAGIIGSQQAKSIYSPEAVSETLLHAWREAVQIRSAAMAL